MANQFLSLSLFLMLLAFFVVMNSVSDFDITKSKPVLNSLSLAFSKDAVPEVRRSADMPNDVEDKRSGDTLETLEGLFNAHISGFKARKNRLGTMMHVQVSVSDFERALRFSDASTRRQVSAVNGAPESFAQTMVSLLRSANNGMPYRVDMVMNIKGDPSVISREDRDAFKADLRRVSAMAQSLERSGLPKNMMSAGLAEGKVGYIELYFNRYVPFYLPKDKLEQVERENGR